MRPSASSLFNNPAYSLGTACFDSKPPAIIDKYASFTAILRCQRSTRFFYARGRQYDPSALESSLRLHEFSRRMRPQRWRCRTFSIFNVVCGKSLTVGRRNKRVVRRQNESATPILLSQTPLTRAPLIRSALLAAARTICE